MMEKRPLYPVDTASFRWIRENGYVYVDKTKFAYSLISDGKFYFLARPRRFGKSLFLDILHEYFRGNRELFKGLEIDRLQPQEWESYPVFHFNLSRTSFDNPEALWSILESTISRQENEFDLNPQGSTIYERFHNLILNVAEKTGKNVVILIDEYDAPLSSSIDKPVLQEIYREQLHGFYSVLKNADNFIQFCMLTGVTRYGKVSVFSGLNNLNDITFSDKYAGICGVTKDELHQYYMEGVKCLAKREGLSMDETYNLLRFHYDGYHFSESLLDIYNPFSINNALSECKIKDYWSQSGLPTLLSKTLMEKDFDIESLNGKIVDESELTNLSMSKMEPVPLFYQTGYLTLKSYDPEDMVFTLGYPNREVERGILGNILDVYAPGNGGLSSNISKMKKSLREGNPKDFIAILESFLSGIPEKLHTHVSKYENYYHTIFYCIIQLIGLDIQAEYSTSKGYIDILIKTDKYIYIIELKINGAAKDAIKQIDDKNYTSPFKSESRKLFKIGIGFSKKTHSIDSSIII